MGPALSPEGLPDPHEDLASAVLGPVEVALFESLYSAYHRDAQRLAHRLLAAPDQAADAVHTAYLEILRYLLSGRRWYEPTDAKAVVLRNVRWAALNIARAHRRRSQVTGAPLGEDTATADDWARVEIRGLCEDIVSRLRPRDREALRLHFVESLSHAEAGHRMGISSQAFQKQLARALRSARRVARAMDAMPSVGFVLPDVAGWRQRRRRRGAARPRRDSAWMRLGRSAAAASLTIACATTAAATLARTEHVAHVAALQAFKAPVSSASPGLGDDSVYDAVVVDLVSVPLTSRTSTLLALGTGRICGCWIVFRSDDAGRTWRQGPGPSVVPERPRLDVAPDFPADGRIFIVSARTNHPVLQAEILGAPFVAVRDGMTSLAQVNHASDQGSVLPVAPGRSLYLDPSGSLFCSGSDGRSWARPCLATTTP